MSSILVCGSLVAGDCNGGPYWLHGIDYKQVITTHFACKMTIKRNTMILKRQTEIVKSEDRQDHGQQNETKDKHRTHDTTLKTKAGVTRTLQKPG